MTLVEFVIPACVRAAVVAPLETTQLKHQAPVPGLLGHTVCMLGRVAYLQGRRSANCARCLSAHWDSAALLP